MSGKRWHVTSTLATPSDGIEDSDLTPSQIVISDSNRNVYEFRHRTLSEAGDATFLNSYERDRSQRCKSVHVLRWGHEASVVRRYMCGGCRKTFTPSTGTIFEDDKLTVADWVVFMVQAFGFESHRGDDQGGQEERDHHALVDGQALPRPEGASRTRWCSPASSR